MSLRKTNPTEVKEVLSKVKPNKATGCDLIPPRVVQLSANVLCHPSSTWINYVLDTAKIPQQWKLDEVTPVYKKDCGLEKSNYRPISILPSLSKVFETLVNARVSPHFEGIYHKFVLPTGSIMAATPLF